MKRFFIIHINGDEFADVLPELADRSDALGAMVSAWEHLTTYEQRRAEFFGLIWAEPDDDDDPGHPGRWDACPDWDTADDVQTIKDGRHAAPVAYYNTGAPGYIFGAAAEAAERAEARENTPPELWTVLDIYEHLAPKMAPFIERGSEVSEFIAWLGWDEWMNAYTDADDGEPITEEDERRIDQIIRDAWNHATA